jgi:hypothetical protein
MTAVRAAMRAMPTPTPTLGARAPSLKVDAQKVVTVVNYKVTSNIKFRLLLCECVSGFAASARAWVFDRVWCWGSARGSRAMTGDVTLARGDACALMVRCIGNALFLWVKLVTDGRILGLEL